MSETEQVAQSRVFELYVESLQADRDTADEVLVVHLRYFEEDVAATIKRLADNPRLAVTLVHHLSSVMQEIDTAAGTADALGEQVASARKWALLLPGSTVNEA